MRGTFPTTIDRASNRTDQLLYAARGATTTSGSAALPRHCPWISASAGLQRLNLIRLQALRALGHDEADLLAFLQ